MFRRGPIRNESLKQTRDFRVILHTDTMKKTTSLLLPVALCVLTAGCVGTGPNTQGGALTGGAIGALAGGIIGNNSGGRTWQGAAIGAAIGAIAGGAIGNSIDWQHGSIYGSEREATTTVVVTEPPAPPPPQPDYFTPQPSPYAVWIPGAWQFNGEAYIWVSGHWAEPPPHYSVYVGPHWAYRGGGGYVFIRGYWR
jgi:hypothetical protein